MSFSTSKERIFMSGMNLFLKDLIKKFNISKELEFIEYTKFTIQKESPENILKLFYFEKFFPVFLKNEVVNKQNINSFSNLKDRILEDSLLNDKNRNIYEFLTLYGGYKKQILDSLLDKYTSVEVQVQDYDTFLKLSKLFLINNTNKWEETFIKNVDLNQINLENSSLNYKLIQHINKHKNLTTLNDNFLSSKDIKTNSTSSQTKLRTVLESLGIKFKEEYTRDGYVYDFYLPEENLILEFDGPVHFYPLQTQLCEKFKFRYRNIKDKFDSKIVLIPYFEFSRYDTTDALKSHIKNKLNKPVEENLFKENYDFFNNNKNLI